MYRDSASRVLEDLAGMRIHAKAGMRSLQHVLKKLTMKARMEARDLPVLMQDLGEGEDHLPVREPQQQPLVQVLAEQQGALLRAGRARVEDLTREGRKYSARQSGLVQRMRGHTLGIVYGPAEALQARVSPPAGVVGLEAGGKLGEVAVEQLLQRVGVPLPVGSRWCGPQRECRPRATCFTC